MYCHNFGRSNCYIVREIICLWCQNPLLNGYKGNVNIFFIYKSFCGGGFSLSPLFIIIAFLLQFIIFPWRFLMIYCLAKLHRLQKGTPLSHWKYKSVKNCNRDLYIIINKTGCSRGMTKYYTFILNPSPRERFKKNILMYLTHHHIYSDPPT